MDVDPNTLIAAGAGLVGVIVGAALSEVRTMLAERRASRRRECDETRARWLDELRQTRRMLGLTVEQVEALAVGDHVAAKRAGSSLHEYDSGTLALIDDADVVRAFQDLLVDLQHRLGQGLRAEDRIRSVTVMGRVADALNFQEERVRSGEAPRRLAPDVAAEIFNADRLVGRMLVIDQPPSTSGWLARRWIDLLAWRTRRRRARGRGDSSPRPPASE